jgi:hypothetical protein
MCLETYKTMTILWAVWKKQMEHLQKPINARRSITAAMTIKASRLK